MIKHYITKYRNDKNERFTVSWLQINFLGKCFCFNKKTIAI
jgi:hypothetical protein